MQNTKTYFNFEGNNYKVVYTINRYLFGNNEKVEHILNFKRHQFKGNSLDDVVSKFKEYLEDKK
jgi:hypothetical protein